MNIFLLLLIVLALGAAAMMFSKRPNNQVPAKNPRKQLSDGASTIKRLASDNKKLTGENARRWLDDFLQKQQKAD